MDAGARGDPRELLGSAALELAPRAVPAGRGPDGRTVLEVSARAAALERDARRLLEAAARGDACVHGSRWRARLALDDLERLAAGSAVPALFALAARASLRPARSALLVGVLNATPDSFSDGGRHLEPAAALTHARRLLDEGADWIDVGGESTRPGAAALSAAEELERVLPVVTALARETDAFVSIDTTKAAVAEAALDAGARAINDVSAGRLDPGLLPLAAERRCPLVLMHMRGTPRDMQRTPRYDDVVTAVSEHLRGRAAAALEAGVEPSALWLDPGIGFGKTLEHNLELLARLGELRSLGLPLYVGVSRKSFIGAINSAAGRGGEPADARVGGTAAAVAAAVSGGAEALRVHDVAIMGEAARVAHALGSLAPRH